MNEEIYKEEHEVRKPCHINARTRPLFREILNKIGGSTKIGSNNLKYGDAIYKLDQEEFNSLFNRWVSKCVEKGIMKKTLSSNCTKHLEWSQELSDVEKALEGLEVARELVK